MNSHGQKPAAPVTAKVGTTQQVQPSLDAPDDRYPGSFFRLPGIPVPGKTTWSSSK